MDRSNQLPRFVRFLFLLLVLAGLSGCGASSDEKEWIGKVSALMSIGDLMSGTIEYTLVLEVSEEEQYVLLVEKEAHLEGIEKTDRGIMWDLGKHYRITGKLIEDENDLKKVSLPAGSKGIVIASKIESLGW